MTYTHRQTWLVSSTSTYHSTDLVTARGVAHLVVHGTSDSTSYEMTLHPSDWRPLSACCRPWTWWCNDATALAGYATMMMMMTRKRRPQRRTAVTHNRRRSLRTVDATRAVHATEAAPAYLADDCRLQSDVGRRPLRSNSNDTRKLLVPRTHNKLADGSFSAAGPRLWNDLRPGLRRPGLTFDSFRQSPKTHLFGDRSA